MFQIIEPTSEQRNHPDFVDGWNACLDDVEIGAPISSAFERGWWTCAKEIADNNASRINILHRIWSPNPGEIISFRQEFPPIEPPPKREKISAPPITHAIVLVGWERLEDAWTKEVGILKISKNTDCSNVVEFDAGTRFPQIVRALGAFSSASDAKRNGWDKDVPWGLTIHPIRINRVRGEIIIHRMK